MEGDGCSSIRRRQERARRRLPRFRQLAAELLEPRLPLAQMFWATPASGEFHTAANWVDALGQPGFVPNGDDATFDKEGAYVLGFSANATVGTTKVTKGAVTLNLFDNRTLQGSRLEVSGTSPAARIMDGVLSVGDAVVASGGTGDLIIHSAVDAPGDPSSRLSELRATNRLTVGTFLGDGEGGIVNNGAIATVGALEIGIGGSGITQVVGNGDDSRGKLIVTGPTSVGHEQVVGQASLSGDASLIVAGGEAETKAIELGHGYGSVGVLQVTLGGRVEVRDGDVVLSVDQGYGAIHVNGEDSSLEILDRELVIGKGWNGRVFVSDNGLLGMTFGDILIGESYDGVLPWQLVGEAYVTTGGTLRGAEDVVLGVNQKAKGVALVDSGGRLFAPNLVVAGDGDGKLDVRADETARGKAIVDRLRVGDQMGNGTVTITGGLVDISVSGSIASTGVNSTGKVVLKDSSHGMSEIEASAADITIGNAVAAANGKGELWVDAGEVRAHAVIVNVGGKLSGKARVKGMVTNNGGMIAAGVDGGIGNVAMLAVDGSLNNGDGTIAVDAPAVADNDLIHVTGRVALGGTVLAAVGFSPEPWRVDGTEGDFIHVLASLDSLTGDIAGDLPSVESFVLPDPVPGYFYEWKIVVDRDDATPDAELASTSQPWIGNGTKDVVLLIWEVPLPEAVDDAYETQVDTELVVDPTGVLNNDLELRPGQSNAAIVTLPEHGTVELSGDGSFVYAPETEFVGADSFTYQIITGLHESEPATVTINVVEEEEEEEEEESPDYTTPAGEDLEVEAPGLLTGFPGGSTAEVGDEPLFGSLTLNPNGSFLYVPDVCYAGFDSFTFVVFDGGGYSAPITVQILVQSASPMAQGDGYEAVVDAELAVEAPGVLANDDDPDCGSLTAVLLTDAVHGEVTLNADGSFTYQPAEGYLGEDSFTYKAFDGASYSDPATVLLTVANGIPVGTGDEYETEVDAQLAVGAPGVLGNDFDADEQELTAELVSDVLHGQLTFNADGSFTYQPDEGFEGEDFFTYKIFDGYDYSDDVVVSILVGDEFGSGSDEGGGEGEGGAATLFYSVPAGQPTTNAVELSPASLADAQPSESLSQELAASVPSLSRASSAGAQPPWVAFDQRQSPQADHKAIRALLPLLSRPPVATHELVTLGPAVQPGDARVDRKLLSKPAAAEEARDWLFARLNEQL